jgi:hypothetical protein
MSYWIPTIAGRVISRTTVQRITKLELGTNKVKERCKEYNERIKALMNDNNHLMHGDGERQLHDWDEYTDAQDEAFNEEFNSTVSDKKINEANANFTLNVFDDTYLNKEIVIARGAGGSKYDQYGRVTKLLPRDADGQPIGTANDNPLLDTREYLVQFLDGHIKAIVAILIAQHLNSQIDEENRQHIRLDDIIDHRKSKYAIDKADVFTTMSNGVKRKRETTQGWLMLCQWKDGSTKWIALKAVRVAEYASANKIDNEPAFAWWVSHMIRNEIEC